jgi:hypothetical protein
MVSFIAVLEQALQVQQFLCANHTKIPYVDRKKKYLDFVSVVSRLNMYCTNVLMSRTMVLLAHPTKVRR